MGAGVGSRRGGNVPRSEKGVKHCAFQLDSGGGKIQHSNMTNRNRILVVGSVPGEMERLQGRSSELLFTEVAELPADRLEDDVAFVLLDYRYLEELDPLPAWIRRTPLVVFNAPVSWKHDKPGLARDALAVFAGPLSAMDVVEIQTAIRKQRAQRSPVDNLATALSRLDSFSRRILTADSPGALKHRLPLLLTTLLTYDGLALWDYSVDELTLFVPDNWAGEQVDLVTGQVREILPRKGGRHELPQTTSRLTLKYLRHTPPAGPIRHFLSAAVGPSEGRLLIFQTGTRGFTATDRRLLDLAATLVGYALRNAQLFGSLEGQSSKIIQKNRELMKASRLKSNFIANTSHELKTPLHAILGLTELMPSADSPAESAFMVERIGVNARRLLEIVNDILDYSRLDGDDLRLYIENIDLKEFTQGLVDSVVDLASVKGLNITWRIDSKKTSFRSDPEKLFRILINILNNAVKFTPSGEVTLRIDDEEDRIRFQISDTGIGIPQEEQARIFEQFHRVQGPLQQAPEGTGLGLAIAQGLTRLLGGDISVQSALGQGSTFTVSLPLTPHIVRTPDTLALPGLEGSTIT